MSVPFERKSPDFAPTGTIRPLRDNVLVKVLDFKLSDTLIADWKGKPVRGIVVAAGPGRYPNIHKKGTRDGKDWRTVEDSPRFRPTEVQVGQTVELGGFDIGGYAFTQIMVDNELHLMVSEQDIAYVHG